jgi:hypothetical protein
MSIPVQIKNTFDSIDTAVGALVPDSIAQYPTDNLGSREEREAVKIIKPEIPNIETILARLRERRPKDGRGGLIVGGYEE